MDIQEVTIEFHLISLRFLEADGHSEKIQMTTGNANYRYDYKDQVILNNISPQFRRWTSGTYEHSEAYTWVKFALDNKDYNVDLYVDSENGKSDGYYTKNKIKTDGKAPTVLISSNYCRWKS